MVFYMLAACARRCAYTNWSTTARDCSDFFTDGQALSMFKRHIARIAFRNNTLTGIPYNQDPAIFGALPRTILYLPQPCGPASHMMALCVTV